MKNGKKFSVDKLKEKYGVVRKIVCSIENEDELINEELINEALNEPHLLEIADQLKKSKINPAILFSHFDIEWDLIDSSNVQEFNKIDAKAKTKIRNTIARRDDIRGIILLRNERARKYTSIISDKKEILDLNNGKVYSFGSFMRTWVGLTTTELMDYVDRADSAIIINWTNAEPLSRNRKQVDRRKSREGMIHNTPEYYEELARENIARYRKIVEQNKAARKAGDFDTIDKDVETIVSAAFKYVQNIRKNFKPNPNNPHNHYFENSKIENIMNEIYDKKTWVGYKATAFSVKDGYSGEDGLLSLYDQYMRLYIRVTATGDSADSKRLNSLKTLLDDKIKVLKKMLNL